MVLKVKKTHQLMKRSVCWHKAHMVRDVR